MVPGMEALVNYFLLRGDNEALGRGELRALLEAYECRDAAITCYTMLCIVRHRCGDIAERIVRRAGYIKEGGLLLAVDNPYDPSVILEKHLLGDSEVHASILKNSVSNTAAEKYTLYLGERHGVRIVNTGRSNLRLLFSDGLVFIGLKTVEQDSKGMYYRSGRHRPYKRSIALTPDVSRLLVNLTRIREGMVLLDPFAGTGSILLEAWSMNIRGIGVEVDWKLVHGMEENLRFYNTNAIPILGDSTILDLISVDAIATDPPYGRGASMHGHSYLELYSMFIDKAWSILRNNSYMSFMTPVELEEVVGELLCRNGFTEVSRYYQYVHGGLTRVIYVVRKNEH